MKDFVTKGEAEQMALDILRVSAEHMAECVMVMLTTVLAEPPDDDGVTEGTRAQMALVVKHRLREAFAPSTIKETDAILEGITSGLDAWAGLTQKPLS